MGVYIDVSDRDRPFTIVHTSPRNIALQDDPEVEDALIQLVMDYHLHSELKVGQSTFRSGDRQEHYVTRRKRNEYTICFHTLPQRSEDTTEPVEDPKD